MHLVQNVVFQHKTFNNCKVLICLCGSTDTKANAESHKQPVKVTGILWTSHTDDTLSKRVCHQVSDCALLLYCSVGLALSWTFLHTDMFFIFYLIERTLQLQCHVELSQLCQDDPVHPRALLWNTDNVICFIVNYTSIAQYYTTQI